MPRTRPMISRGGPLDGIVDDAIGEIDSLKEEMQDWMDSLSSNNMEHLPKYEEVSECYNALENATGNTPEMPTEFLPGMALTYEWQEKAPYKGAQSRSTRCSNATNDIEQVITYIDDSIQNLDDQQTEEHADLIAEWEQYRNDLEEIVNEAQNASFPGMY